MNVNIDLGPDGVTPAVVKYNMSFAHSLFPDEWKRTILIPVFKKDDKHNIKNDRLIIMNNVFSKIFESIVFHKLYKASLRIIINEQHGFVEGRSMNTNLCVFTETLISTLNARDQVDVICTD